MRVHRLSGWRGIGLAVSLMSLTGLASTSAFAADTTPPTIEVTSPAPNSTVSGPVFLAATASDDVGVASVQFLLDGQPAGPVLTAAPYEFWADSAQVVDGTYGLAARALDAAGNVGTAASRSVTVANATTTPPPPPPPEDEEPPSPPPTPPPTTPGLWDAPVQMPVVPVHATLLRTNAILFWAAWEPQANAYLLNLATQATTYVPSSDGLFCSGHALLPDGRVLVNGGHSGIYSPDDPPDMDHENAEIGIVQASLFDPAKKVWTRMANMAYARWYPTTILLSTGKLLTVGGQIIPNIFADTPELFDLSKNRWTPLSGVATGDMQTEEYPQLYQLPNGLVWMSNPSTGETSTLNLNTKAYVPGPATSAYGSTVMYRPGKILMTGGGPPNQPSTTVAQVLDMTASNPTWRTIAPMAFPRFMHNFVLLPDGTVLVIGGANIVDVGVQDQGSLPAELWDPATEQWTTLASMAEYRNYHSVALLLPDGRVWAAGGVEPTAQIFSPPYLQQGSRPVVTGAPNSIGYGRTITIKTPQAMSIRTAVLLAPISGTHSTTDQRYLELPIQSRTSSSLAVVTPVTTATAPRGYYLLFIVDTNGVPSVGRFLKLS